jgi:polyisoprenoid-binding protein YceI
MKNPILTLVPALLILVGCSNPADDVAEARVGAQTTTDTSAAVTGGDYFAIDTATSTIGFVGSKVTGSHEGGFKEFAGELRIVGGKIADAGNKVVIVTPSMFTDNQRLTGHLMSADFFDVATHPVSTFETTSIASNADGTATVTGNLSLHGVTKSISFPATINVSNSEVTVKADFHIDRFDFDMKYAGKADDLIRKEVVLKFDIKARPGRAEFSKVQKPETTAALPSPRG